MADPDPFVFLAVGTVWFIVIGSIVGGLFILSNWWWARCAWRDHLAADRLDLYRVAGQVAAHRFNDWETANHRDRHCGCPMCGGSYGAQFLTEWSSDDVG